MLGIADVSVVDAEESSNVSAQHRFFIQYVVENLSIQDTLVHTKLNPRERYHSKTGAMPTRASSPYCKKNNNHSKGKIPVQYAVQYSPAQNRNKFEETKALTPVQCAILYYQKYIHEMPVEYKLQPACKR